MTYKYLLLQKENQFATITLNRPEKLNALNHELFIEMGSAFDSINEKPDVRAVIIKGAGRAFSAGTDLQALGSGSPDRTHPGYRYHLCTMQDIFYKIERLEKPVIAQIHGYALGAAMELILACDFRIAAEDTRFSLPEVVFGIIPDLGGCQRLVRVVGLPKAKELVMMGRNIDGAEAEIIGLVNKAVKPEDLEGEVRQWADEFLQLPPLSVGLGKRMVDKGLDMDMLSSLEMNSQIQSMLVKTDDFKEGISAKLENRAPSFNGK